MTDPTLYTALVPTLLLPLTLLSVIVTTIATYIAGLFGVELKAEGPKKLLELLLKPKLLVSAIILNVIVVAGVKYYQYQKHAPESLATITRTHAEHAQPAQYTYTDSAPNVVDVNVPSATTGRTDRITDLVVLWTTKLPNGAFRRGTLSGDRIFYGSDDGHIYELDTATGKQIRKFFVGTELTPNPLIWQGRIFTGEGIHYTHHARVYSFDLATGDFLKSYETLGHTQGQPVVGSFNGTDLLFVVAGKDGLHAIDPTTFERHWQSQQGHIDGSVRTVNGRVFAGSAVEKGDEKNSECSVAAYDFATGDVLWEQEIPASSWVAPLLIDDGVFFVLGEIYDESDFGQLLGLDQATGKARMVIDTRVPMSSTPINVGPYIYAVDRLEQINRFNIETGTLDWTAATTARETQTSVAAVSYDPHRHLLLYPSFENGLYVLDPDTGDVLKHWVPDESTPWRDTYAAVVATENAWFINDVKGTVRCVKPSTP